MLRKSYFQREPGAAQLAIVQMLEPGQSVLEVGCAGGHMTRLMKEKGCRVTAVEIDAEQGKSAREHAERLILGDIESADTWAQIEGPFEVIVFADVLEHLRDPWEVLRRARHVLKDNGRVLASIPNAAYWHVRLGLLMGRFEYTQFGILDDTHLRFFTAGSAKRLFAKTGYRIERFLRIVGNRNMLKLGRIVLPNWFTYQFVIKAKPKHPGSNN
ncbi:MAG: class I SAM-dependent methyltransferase [Armatimonadota bacterium]